MYTHKKNHTKNLRKKVERETTKAENLKRVENWTPNLRNSSGDTTAGRKGLMGVDIDTQKDA